MDGYVPFLVALIGLWGAVLLLCGIVAARETLDWWHLRRRHGAHHVHDPAGPAARTVLEIQQRLRREAARPARSLVVRGRPSVSPRAGGDPVIDEIYAATPYLRRLTAANGWRGDLLRDAHGEPVAVVTVRVGPRWTDSVAIAGETDTVAMRHRTRESELIVPAHLPPESGAVWQRHGRCAAVLAELLELPIP